MDESIFLLKEQDNVGDVLGKINYNFLKNNNDLSDLESSSKENYSVINKINSLMDLLDYLIIETDFNKFQDLYTSVNLLSSYWNQMEFTVQIPFNPTNGFTTTLVSGAGGQLMGSTDLTQHEKILTDALLFRKLPYIENLEQAKSSLYTNGIIMVNRNDYGDFVTWDYISSKNILSILVDESGDFYYNGRLVDIYNIPYYSVVTSSNVDIYKSLTPDFDKKIVLLENNTPLLPSQTDLNANVLIIYEKINTTDYDIGDGTFAPTVQFVPYIENLNKIILDNNKTFEAKINSSYSDNGSISENNKIHNISLNFLNEKYPAVNYMDNTVVNVVFMLYNAVGSNLGEVSVETLYWTDQALSDSKRDIEIIKKSSVSKIAPGSNTTFNMTYNKKNVYIEKIVNVKYIKNEQMKEVVTLVNGAHKITTIPISTWVYKGLNIGRSYQPDLFLNSKNFTQATIKGTPSLEYTG